MMKKLMEKCRMIRENLKKNGTKGFSMVELIIVIAIMAILVALIGTQLIPYLEKSRRTRDLDTMNAMLTAAQTIITDHELDVSIDEDIAKIVADDGYKEEFESYLGYKWNKTSDDGVGKKLTSKNAKGQLPVISAMDDDKNIIISVSDGTNGGLYVASDGTKGETDKDGKPKA